MAEIPDRLDPADEIPRTVEGMLQEMNDLMREQLDETDSLTAVMTAWDRMQERAHPGSRDFEFAMLSQMTRVLLKLQSQVALHSMCLERMYHELRPRY